MEDQELKLRLNDIMKNALAPGLEQEPDISRYSLMTTYPYGVFKASDLYLWLDKLLKISKVKTIRESPTGLVTGTISLPISEEKKAGEILIALKKKKEAKTEEVKIAPEIKKIEKEIQKVVEAPKILSPIREEFEIESKGDISEMPISVEEMKSKDEEETVKKEPKGIGIPYLDAHQNPNISLPYLLTEDAAKKSIADMSRITESMGSEVFQDRIEITKRLLELTKLKLSEKNLDNKKKIDSEIVLLRDRMKLDKTKTTSSDTSSIVLGHLATELDSVLEELKRSIESKTKELNSIHDSAKNSAGDNPSLISQIESQFIKDSSMLVAQIMSVTETSESSLLNLHFKEIDIAVEKGIFTKQKGDAEKSRITKDYPVKFKFISSKSEEINQRKEEVANTGSYSEAIKGILNMKEAELLHELSASDRKSFLSYIKGEMSKPEAVLISKRNMAKEKGIPNNAIDQFFPLGVNR